MRKERATQQWIYKEDYQFITHYGLQRQVHDGISLPNFADAVTLILNEYRLLKEKSND